MRFKPAVEWEKRGNGYFVAKVPFGMQLTVRKEGNWIWGIGNMCSVFESGRSDSERDAKENAEYVFQRYFNYVIENNREYC